MSKPMLRVLRLASARVRRGQRALLAALLLTSCLTASSLAWGAEDQIVLSRPWARLRSQPAETGRAVALVYGNDVLTVLERRDGWVQVETPAKVRGWLSPQDASGAAAQVSTGGAAAQGSTAGAAGQVSTGGAAGQVSTAGAAGQVSTGGAAVQPGKAGAAEKESSVVLPPLPASNARPASTDSLRRLGYEEAARRRLTEELLIEHDTPAAYRATRDMLTYHPIGNLPPLQGNTIPKDARGTANRLRESVLLEEGRALDREGKPWDAILLYESLMQSEPKNGRAHLALLDALTRFMQQSAQSPNMENLGVAISIYRKSFPDLALPPGVEAGPKDSKTNGKANGKN